MGDNIPVFFIASETVVICSRYLPCQLHRPRRVLHLSGKPTNRLYCTQRAFPLLALPATGGGPICDVLTCQGGRRGAGPY